MTKLRSVIKFVAIVAAIVLAVVALYPFLSRDRTQIRMQHALERIVGRETFMERVSIPWFLIEAGDPPNSHSPYLLIGLVSGCIGIDADAVVSETKTTVDVIAWAERYEPLFSFPVSCNLMAQYFPKRLRLDEMPLGNRELSAQCVRYPYDYSGTSKSCKAFFMDISA